MAFEQLKGVAAAVADLMKNRKNLKKEVKGTVGKKEAKHRKK